MASEHSKRYSLRLELRDGDGRIVGEISATLSGDALRDIVHDETPRASTEGSANSHTPGERTEPSRDRHPHLHPRPFRGRDDNPTAARGDERAMSTEQRKFLFRLAYGLGFKKDTATNKVLETLGVERFEWATRGMASRAIDTLKEQVAMRRQGSNGAYHG